jgi:hypothetical protein
VPRDDRERFEQEYRDWIRLMSRDAACRLEALPADKKKEVLAAYEDFRDPLAVFRPLQDPKRVKRLKSEMISNFIVLETDAITFFPSVYSSAPAILDYAVAMNRCIFCKGLWFPIIALNSAYVQQSSDRMLCFALEHELEMNRIYQSVSLNLKALSREEKQNAMNSALEISANRLKITQQELIEDERLMYRLSMTEPLIPKPYAERAMLILLEANLPRLQSFGRKSRSVEEEVFGDELYEEFQGWSEFSQRTYDLFIREILLNLRDENRGYG